MIRDREQHEQTTETRIVWIDKAERLSAEQRDSVAQLTVRFVSQMISVTATKPAPSSMATPEKVADINDVWTFARNITSRDPNWKLVGTGSAVSNRLWLPVRGVRVLACLLIAAVGPPLQFLTSATRLPRHRGKAHKHRAAGAGRRSRTVAACPIFRVPLKFTDSQLEPLKWSDLDNWGENDGHAAAFTTFPRRLSRRDRGAGELRQGRSSGASRRWRR